MLSCSCVQVRWVPVHHHHTHSPLYIAVCAKNAAPPRAIAPIARRRVAAFVRAWFIVWSEHQSEDSEKASRVRTVRWDFDSLGALGSTARSSNFVSSFLPCHTHTRAPWAPCPWFRPSKIPHYFIRSASKPVFQREPTLDQCPHRFPNSRCSVQDGFSIFSSPKSNSDCGTKGNRKPRQTGVTSSQYLRHTSMGPTSTRLRKNARLLLLIFDFSKLMINRSQRIIKQKILYNSTEKFFNIWIWFSNSNENLNKFPKENLNSVLVDA